ncbi:hypothetical protein BDW22DRAFT_1342241 [Trametopsis cervina]|nr:hypothetical protein BDW22DRAFT_1342241 [Trametopsis cervina]
MVQIPATTNANAPQGAAAPHWIRLKRTVVFGVLTVFSIIILGLAAHMIAETTTFDFYFRFDAFALAIALLTILTLPAMWIVDILRRGAFTSLIFVELVWLGLLWVLWLTSAALSSNDWGSADCGLSVFFLPSWYTSSCGHGKAIIAFSWLNWVILTSYLVSLLFLSITANNRGAPVWRSSVREATFVPARVDLGGAASHEPKGPVSYPPQPTGAPAVYSPTQSANRNSPERLNAVLQGLNRTKRAWTPGTEAIRAIRLIRHCGGTRVMPSPLPTAMQQGR